MSTIAPDDWDDDENFGDVTKDTPDKGAQNVGRELKDTENVASTKGKMTKAESAAAMRVRGLTIQEIRAVLEYDSDAQVRAAIEAVIADSLDNYDREALRVNLDSRLEQLWRLAYKRARDDKNPQRETATKNALAVLNRMAELHGLDAPKEILMHHATAQEISEWVEKVATSEIAALPAEVDIIDVEIEDDEDPGQ